MWILLLLLKIVFGLVGGAAALALLGVVVLFPILIIRALISLFRIPLPYTLGNIKARRVSTAMSILGIGVVIAVLLSMMALDNGVIKATVSSGSKDNLMITRDGADTELSSWVSKDATHIIRTLPGIAKDAKGEPLVAPELVIIFKLPRGGAPNVASLLIRGVSPAS